MDLIRVRPPDVVDFLDKVARAPEDASPVILCAMMNEDERDKLVAACYSVAVQYDEFRVACLNMNPAFKQIGEAFERQSKDIRAIAASLNELA